MEVSSHALALSRVDGIEFDVAVFTNLTQDHLDFHGTLEAYRDAKARLFTLLAAEPQARRTAVVNTDDPAGAAMVRRPPPICACGRSPSGCAGRPSCGRARWDSGIDGIRLEVRDAGGPHRDRLAAGRRAQRDESPGGHRRRTGSRHGAATDRRDALAGVATVPGRFERVEAGQPFLVVVDYAHTPDALERVLATARKLVRPGGRLGVVFGCGGDRDRGKRPIMGGIAARLADRAWVTSDNPRTERPEAILAEIVDGHPGRGRGDRHESHGRPAGAPSRPRWPGRARATWW